MGLDFNGKEVFTYKKPVELDGSNVRPGPVIVLNSTPKETVNHPKHYNFHPSGFECIDVIEEMSFNVGSAIKYLWRAGLKSEETLIEDLKKALWYIQREIDRKSKS